MAHGPRLPVAASRRLALTLAELLVASVLLVLVLAQLWPLLTSALASDERTRARAIAQSEVHRALDEVLRIARRSSAIAPLPVHLTPGRGARVEFSTVLHAAAGQATLVLDAQKNLVLDRSRDGGPGPRTIARDVPDVRITPTSDTNLIGIQIERRVEYATRASGAARESVLAKVLATLRSRCTSGAYIEEH
jgi:hypothetical protein